MRTLEELKSALSSGDTLPEEVELCLKEIERLERELAEVKAWHVEEILGRADCQAQAAAMREALVNARADIEARGGPVCQYIDEVLSPDAGKKVLAVVEAAKAVEYHRPNLLPDKHGDLQDALDKLHKTLAALEESG